MSQSPKPPEPPAPPEPGCRPQQGYRRYEPSLATDALRRAAINQAFDYRGDVTIQTTDGRTVEGYVFDRVAEGAEPYLRVLTPDGARLKLLYSEVTHVRFTGRDAATGKSWETWAKNYAQKQRQSRGAGQRASEN